jgi:GNAT superfamily N-acetyltransferase
MPKPAPALEDLRGHRVLAVDLNHDHLAAWIVTGDGNPAGSPVTIGLRLAGLPASQRDGRLRAAISALLRTAREHGCAAIAVEDLSFTDAREQGRERHGNRPSRGKPGRAYRRMLAGIPTGKFRDRLAQMAPNAGLAVIAVDPAYTSRWGGRALARPAPGPGHDHHQAPRGRGSDRQTRARPPGAATGRHDQRRPADRPPESCPHSASGPQRGQERQAPQGPAAAATAAEDRDGRPGTPARPGDPRPFGAAR